MNTTLVTQVTIHRIDGVTRMRDVPTDITRRGRHTDIEFTHLRDEVGVTVRLTEAERIALIEGLGGKA